MCLVRPPEDETAVQLVRTFAVDRCDLIQLVSRFLRILFSGTGKPYGIQGECIGLLAFGSGGIPGI